MSNCTKHFCHVDITAIIAFNVYSRTSFRTVGKVKVKLRFTRQVAAQLRATAFQKPFLEKQPPMLKPLK